MTREEALTLAEERANNTGRRYWAVGKLSVHDTNYSVLPSDRRPDYPVCIPVEPTPERVGMNERVAIRLAWQSINDASNHISGTAEEWFYGIGMTDSARDRHRANAAEIIDLVEGR